MIEIRKYQLGKNIIGITGYKGYIGANFITNKQLLSDQSEIPDIIVHLAAHNKNEIITFTDNLSIDLEIVNYCKKNNIKLIYASGNNVYPLGMNFKETDPVYSKDFYGLSKIAGECLIQNRSSELDFIILRIGDVFGKNQKYGNFFKMLAKCIEQRNPLILYGSGSKIRSYIYIDELVSILDFFCFNFSTYSKNIYNTCFSEPFSIYDIVTRVSDTLNLPIEKKEYQEEYDTRTMNNHKMIKTGYPFMFNTDQALVHFIEEVKIHD